MTVRALAAPVWRSLPWRALAAAGGSGLLLAGAARLPDRAPDPELGRLLLRLTALAGALGLAFLLDDPARRTTAATPVGRASRAAVRLALAAPVAALWWTAALLLVPAQSRPALTPATVEAAATACTALALATLAVRFTDTAEVGKGAAVWLGAAAGVTLLVPDRWGLLGTPADPWWQATQLRWAAVLALTLTLCATGTREPVRRRSRRPVRGPAPSGY
ncbi:ABC transporter [Streptomyces sp. ID05-04B]|uniref:ABC transporter n=1 Tax=Streptomyces sp. ID05-04B TaxID=3028661 RepID=UPI0029C1A627|nr:ABC transporter [Streptomyces sp. ID05-04B]MDX5570698.1 ABC transporter [Streptomyces sp. ID05-04B]